MTSRGLLNRVLGVTLGLLTASPATPVQSPDPERMDAESIREMLREHNALRSERGIAPLRWSPSLADSAQRWAEHLAAIGFMEHNARFRAGQNLYVIHGATARPARVVRRWADEGKDYREPQKACRSGAECGHFTQLIWAATQEVGCGFSSGKRGQFWVCFYLPPGNVEGEKPY